MKRTSWKFSQRCNKMEFVANMPIGSFHALPIDGEAQFAVEIHEYEKCFTWFFAFAPDLKNSGQDQGVLLSSAVCLTLIFL